MFLSPVSEYWLFVFLKCIWRLFIYLAFVRILAKVCERYLTLNNHLLNCTNFPESESAESIHIEDRFKGRYSEVYSPTGIFHGKQTHFFLVKI